MGLTPTDMIVLLNVLMHWWYADQRPFPRISTIAARMGVDVRTVQRSLKKMTELGLLATEREAQASGGTRSVFSLGGLVSRLEHLVRGDPDYVVRRARRGARPAQSF